jgi:hypothetical protein
MAEEGCVNDAAPEYALRRQKMPFTPVEDAWLAALVRHLGRTSWTEIAARMPHRTSRQCRERWVNYLNPDLSQSPWRDCEDHILRSKYAELGPKWVKISEYLPRRSANSIKNRALLLERIDHHQRVAPAWKGIGTPYDPLGRLFENVKIDIFYDDLSDIFAIA